MKTRKALGYTRVSKRDRKLGRQAQRLKIQSWADAHDVAIVGWHHDDISGTSELHHRPGLVAALSKLSPKSASLLIVAHNDRLARDLYVAEAIHEAARRMGGTVASADNMGNGADAFSTFVRQIFGAAAQLEAALIRERTRAALHVKIRAGKRCGCIPWGFRIGPDGETLEPDEYEQQIFSLVHRLRSSGLSINQIRYTLRESGAQSRTGKPLERIQIRNMLNRAGMGPRLTRETEPPGLAPVLASVRDLSQSPSVRPRSRPQRRRVDRHQTQARP